MCMFCGTQRKPIKSSRYLNGLGITVAISHIGCGCESLTVDCYKGNDHARATKPIYYCPFCGRALNTTKVYKKGIKEGKSNGTKF